MSFPNFLTFLLTSLDQTAKFGWFIETVEGLINIKSGDL